MSSKPLGVFDFDGTLYQGDSLFDFSVFYYRKKLLRCWRIPVLLLMWLGWKLSLIQTQKFKQRFIGFIKGDTEEEIQEKAEEFWRTSSKYNAKVCQELKQAKERGMLTVVVSASPHLFIAPAVKSLGADLLIATPLTIKPSAYLLGENCRGKEKIRRLKEEFGELNMLVAYSDNEDDVPLLRLAEKGYRVVKNEIVPLT